MSKWLPVFKKDDDEFILPYEDITGETEEDAWKIGWGVSFVEGILYRFNFVRTMEMPGDPGLLHRKASLNDLDIWIIAGPHFDEIATPVEKEE